MAQRENTAPKPEFDGRRRRSKNSQEKIVEAVLRLHDEGVMAPTAHEIAAKSGVSIRTVFRLNEDMESIFVEADRLLYDRFEPDFMRPIVGAGLEDRLYNYILRRMELYKACGAQIRATKTQMWKFPSLERNYRKLLRHLQRDMFRWLPELSEASKSTQMAAETLLSFETWDRMRRYAGESQKQCGEAVFDSILTLMTED